MLSMDDIKYIKRMYENKVGYKRRNLFVPVPTILDFDQFNQNLFRSYDKDVQRCHYVKEELI